MADLSDITAYLATQAALAVYPNGTGNPSVANMDVHVFEGWPIAAQLDLDVRGLQIISPGMAPTPRPGGPCADVSVYPMPGATAEPYQIQDETYVVAEPVFGMSASVAGDVITITGQPNTGEYLTLVADRTFVFSATGANTAAILSSLATQAGADYAGVSSTSTTLTVPFKYALTVRIGGVGVLGKATHRQRHGVMLTTWAPDPTARTKIAAAIDNLLKRTIIATMPDTSQARIVYSKTILTDEMQQATVYRRDLVFDVDYATVFEFPGYVITSFTVDVAGGNWELAPGNTPPTIPTSQ